MRDDQMPPSLVTPVHACAPTLAACRATLERRSCKTQNTKFRYTQTRDSARETADAQCTDRYREQDTGASALELLTWRRRERRASCILQPMRNNDAAK